MKELIEPVIALAIEAGQAIMPFWRQGTQVHTKDDQSPVTAADLAAHKILAEGLGALAADIAVLSEEDADIDQATRAAWQRWWLVDPLDGTKEFISDSPEFTVNIALIENAQVVFGVVHVPATGVTYFGGKAFGAFKRDAAGTQAIGVRQTPSEAFVVVASRRHSSPAQEALLQGLAEQVGTLELSNIGSSLKFCLLAEGLADCYPRLAPTSQWDTAAAQGVVEGAGGVVLELNGAPFSYPARVSLLNPSFVCLPANAPWREALLAKAKAL